MKKQIFLGLLACCCTLVFAQSTTKVSIDMQASPTPTILITQGDTALCGPTANNDSVRLFAKVPAMAGPNVKYVWTSSPAGTTSAKDTLPYLTVRPSVSTTYTVSTSIPGCPACNRGASVKTSVYTIPTLTLTSALWTLYQPFSIQNCAVSIPAIANITHSISNAPFPTVISWNSPTGTAPLGLIEVTTTTAANITGTINELAEEGDYIWNITAVNGICSSPVSTGKISVKHTDLVPPSSATIEIPDNCLSGTTLSTGENIGASFANATITQIKDASNTVVQEWSAPVIAGACRKTTYAGGSNPYSADCRSNNGTNTVANITTAHHENKSP